MDTLEFINAYHQESRLFKHLAEVLQKADSLGVSGITDDLLFHFVAELDSLLSLMDDVRSECGIDRGVIMNVDARKQLADAFCLRCSFVDAVHNDASAFVRYFADAVSVPHSR